MTIRHPGTKHARWTIAAAPLLLLLAVFLEANLGLPLLPITRPTKSCLGHLVWHTRSLTAYSLQQLLLDDDILLLQCNCQLRQSSIRV
jgi:hypothetical protein